MIAPYIDRDEKIEEVPKEVEIRMSQVIQKKSPCIGYEKEYSYHDGKQARNESRVVESSCEIVKFLRTLSPISDRIDDRVRDDV